MPSDSSLGVYGQWRVQDWQEGGAKPIAREARVQKFKPRPKNVDHAPR